MSTNVAIINAISDMVLVFEKKKSGDNQQRRKERRRKVRKQSAFWFVGMKKRDPPLASPLTFALPTLSTFGDVVNEFDRD